MAVPLVDKGVVVVAVGYDIAPKGRVFSFLTTLFLLLGGIKEIVKMNCEQQPSACVPFASSFR